MKVIYKDMYGYKVTDENNYCATIQNANAVINCNKFTSAKQIIDYFVKFCKSNENDFIIIDD